MGKGGMKLAWLGLAALLAGCGAGADGAAGRGAEDAAVATDPAFVAGHDAWRASRRESLLQPDGWTSLVGLHWIELPAHYVGSGSANGIRLAKGPEKLGMLQQKAGTVTLVPEPGVALSVDGQPQRGAFVLHADHSATPTVVGFDEGRGQLSLIERNGRKALRVKHAESPALLGLGPLDYWPADASWRTTARFVAHPGGRTMPIVDIMGHQQAMPNPGVVEFERAGAAYRLEALAGEDGGLFLVFADRTSGHDSYAAGRYVYTAAPDARGQVEVDFNRAINPPCVFTDFATCPLPPPENRLDLAVTAGEKKYARPAG